MGEIAWHFKRRNWPGQVSHDADDRSVCRQDKKLETEDDTSCLITTNHANPCKLTILFCYFGVKRLNLYRQYVNLSSPIVTYFGRHVYAAFNRVVCHERYSVLGQLIIYSVYDPLPLIIHLINRWWHEILNADPSRKHAYIILTPSNPTFI